MTAHTVVVGAGWSGLAAAVTLLDAGHQVTLVDAAPQTGGRARRVPLVLGDRSYLLDNGQHLLIGAYAEYLALARRVGISIDERFFVRPFALRYPDGFRMVAARAPAPLHLAAALAFARGLSLGERYAAAMWVRGWQRRNWTLAEDLPADTLFAHHPQRLVDRVWAPLCLAALNVRLQEASARVVLRVLGDTLGRSAQASDLLLARGDLSALFPDAAEAAIRAAGGVLRLREPVQALEPGSVGSRWRVQLRSESLGADAVVLALPPARTLDLLESAGRSELRPAIDQLAALGTAPIATVYLRYSETTRLPHPFYALEERPRSSEFGQWVFDRGLLEPRCAGVLSVVVSGTGPHTQLLARELTDAVTRQLARAFHLPAPIATAMLVEKRATITPGPNVERPGVRLAVPGLFLAGDSAASPYPSTLEGSIRAGLAAARAAAEPKISAV